MRNKPGWAFWWIWMVGYSVLDMLLEVLVHGRVTWGGLAGALEGAAFGATVTWLFALWRWYKAEESL